jgi:hypothetical protein
MDEPELPGVEDLSRVVKLARAACSCEKCAAAVPHDRKLPTSCLAPEIVEGLLDRL